MYCLHDLYDIYDLVDLVDLDDLDYVDHHLSEVRKFINSTRFTVEEIYRVPLLRNQ